MCQKVGKFCRREKVGKMNWCSLQRDRRDCNDQEIKRVEKRAKIFPAERDCLQDHFDLIYRVGSQLRRRNHLSRALIAEGVSGRRLRFAPQVVVQACTRQTLGASFSRPLKCVQDF